MKKVRLSLQDAITVASLRRELDRVGEGYYKWELCATYGVAALMSVFLFAYMFQRTFAQVVVPVTCAIAVWASVAVVFHVMRARLWMSAKWLPQALSIEPFQAQPDTLRHVGPYGAVRWGAARRWMEAWLRQVELPSPEELDNYQRPRTRKAGGAMPAPAKPVGNTPGA